MASYGFSPPTRIFEAAGAAVCLITDAWEGIETFLTPDREVLVAHDAEDVVSHLLAVDDKRAREIGDAALQRVLSEHTYGHRAVQLERLLMSDSRAKTQSSKEEVVLA
jgi:spore maturation protein CgeB